MSLYGSILSQLGLLNEAPLFSRPTWPWSTFESLQHFGYDGSWFGGTRYFVREDGVLVPYGRPISPEDIGDANGAPVFIWERHANGSIVDAVSGGAIPDPDRAQSLPMVDLADVAYAFSETTTVSIDASLPSHMSTDEPFSLETRIYDELSDGREVTIDLVPAHLVEISGVLAQKGWNATQTLDISAPARLSDGSLSDETSLQIRLVSSSGSEEGDSEFYVILYSSNGRIVGSQTSFFSLEFDASGQLIGDPVRRIEVDWNDDLGAANSTIGLDLSGLTTADAGAASLTWHLGENGGVAFVDVEVDPADGYVRHISDAVLRFDQNGILQEAEPIALDIDWYDWRTGAQNALISLDLAADGAVAVGGDDFHHAPPRQNGTERGQLSSVEEDGAGGYVARFDNGMALAVVRNDESAGSVTGDNLARGQFLVDLRAVSENGHGVVLKNQSVERRSEDGSRSEIIGGDADDRLVAEASSSHIDGGDGSDWISGGDRSDLLFGGAGDDRIFGQDGDDRFVGLSGRDFYDGMGGFDTLDLQDVASGVTSNGGRVWTTAGDLADINGVEHISGTMFADLLKANTAFARLVGRSGDDTLVGGDQDDRLFGNSGADILRGHAGDDYLSGDGENDVLNGGAGNDLALGGAGDDVLVGREGDDVLKGGDHDDRAYGDGGDDQLFGGSGLDRLKGGDGQDLLEGGAGDDHLLGGAGDDRMAGGGGTDRMVGGAGADVFVFAPGECDDVIYDFEAGLDQIDLSAFGGLTFESDIQPFLLDLGERTVVRLGEDDVLLLRGVAVGDLGAGDFILAG